MHIVHPYILRSCSWVAVFTDLDFGSAYYIFSGALCFKSQNWGRNSNGESTADCQYNQFEIGDRKTQK